MPRKIRDPQNLDKIDMAKLKASGYSEKADSFPKVFLLRHKKYPGKVVELRALSSIHACNLIGWRPRQVEVLEQRDAETEETEKN